jgi:hypothetical protein
MVGGTVLSGDLDIQALQAKLAAQEARLNDLQAKIGGGSGGSAANVTSIRKNAKVTIGGEVNTRYFFHSGSVKDAAGEKIVELKASDLKNSDAKLNFSIAVNDYFDAFVRINLLDGGRGGQTTDISTAQYAWVRWKNLCNSGFGVVVGRDNLVFGSGDQAGMVSEGFVKHQDFLLGTGDSLFNRFSGSWIANRITWDQSRTTQVTPYWESPNGKFKAEISFFQDYSQFDGGRYFVGSNTGADLIRSENYGLGSMSGRVRVTPIEGLNIYASAINRYRNNRAATSIIETLSNKDPKPPTSASLTATRNNSAVNAGFDYKPCALPRLHVFAEWTHNWNVNWHNESRLDYISGGFTFGLTEQLKFALQGDYLWGKRGGLAGASADELESDKFRGWAIYPAIRYTLPYGVNFELGYRYEQVKNRRKTTLDPNNRPVGDKATLSTVYAQVGFNF